MANEATIIGSRPVSCLGRGKVDMVKAAFDTTGSDLTVFTPSSGNMTALVGITSSKTTAATTIKFTAGSKVVAEHTIANGVCLDKDILNRILFGVSGDVNEAIKIQTDTAVTLYLSFVQGRTLEAVARS